MFISLYSVYYVYIRLSHVFRLIGLWFLNVSLNCGKLQRGSTF